MVNQVIKSLLEISSNSYCADCRSNVSTHVACLFGVFICARCYQFHKTILFGKAKVLPFDSNGFTDKDLKVLQTVGNEKSNEKYEKNVPECYKRPTNNDPSVLIEQWIKAKYERKEFSEPDAKLPYLENIFEGYLWKRGKEKNVFKTRKFVLNKNSKLLMYYTKEGPEAQPKAKLNVDRLEVYIEPEKVGKDFGMQIMVEGSDLTRSMYVYAESGEDLVNWYTAIHACKLQWLQIAFPCTPIEEFYKMLWPKISKEGWLWKSGPKKNDSFYRRWVVIVKRKLLYYLDPLDPFPKGEVFIGNKEQGSYSVKTPLNDGADDNGEDSNSDGNRLSASSSGGSTSAGNAFSANQRRECSFFVETPRRIFAFKAETEVQRQEWVDAVQYIIDQPLTSSDQKTFNRTGVKKVVSKRLSNLLSKTFSNT